MQCMERDGGSDADDNAPYHGHGQPTGGTSTTCHILKHIYFEFELDLDKSTQIKYCQKAD